VDVREIDPLSDNRWDAFVRSHPAGSVFHSTGWLEALRRTYGCQPAALAECDSDGNLSDALVFCRINSWLTGRRIVSLPFSDHCEPLVENDIVLAELIDKLQAIAKMEHCKYVEVRPFSVWLPANPFKETETFYLHRLDLRSRAENIFKQFHRDCVQRKIRKAEREGLTLRQGRSPEHLRDFYALVVRTRRRQGLPPQPISWFRNVLECLGGAAAIRLVYKGDLAIAGILTLEHERQMVYKYGASDESFHNLGGMPYLFWTAIQEGIARRMEELDLGRSDLDNPGLIAFKEHLGARRSVLSYWRSPATPKVTENAWKLRLLARACSLAPDRVLTSAGSLLYRHIA
jgi:lipid II:glycine glycyltransferase (peptidoglycan interpeptide bridge formation enzyme)